MPPIFSPGLVDDPLGGLLHSQLLKARETLNGVEENLNKLMGPVPPPPSDDDHAVENKGTALSDLKNHDREFNGRGTDRRAGGGFDTGGKRNFRVMENDGGGDQRRPRPLAERLGVDPVSGEPPLKRRLRLEPEEEEVDKPKLSSSVVKTGNEARTREEAIRNGEKDKQTNARNRRMFGCLLGTLRQFQKEETALKTKEEKRARVEKKVEERSKAERDRVNQERRDLISQKRLQQQEIKRIEYKMHRLSEAKDWEDKVKLQRNFIRTKASPPIFWLPKVMCPASTKKLEESRAAIDEMLAEKSKKLQEEFERMDRAAEARAERQKAMGNDQGWRRGGGNGNGRQRRDEDVEMDDLFAEDSHAKLAESVDEIMFIQAKARRADADKPPAEIVKEEPLDEGSGSPDREPVPTPEPNNEKPDSPQKKQQVSEDEGKKASRQIQEKEPEKPTKNSRKQSSSSSDSESDDEEGKKQKKIKRARKESSDSSSSSDDDSSDSDDDEDDRPERVSIKQEPVVKAEPEEEGGSEEDDE